jgi:hypothetical protein
VGVSGVARLASVGVWWLWKIRSGGSGRSGRLEGSLASSVFSFLFSVISFFPSLHAENEVGERGKQRDQFSFSRQHDPELRLVGTTWEDSFQSKVHMLIFSITL